MIPKVYKDLEINDISRYRAELMGVATIMVILCHSLMPPSIYVANNFVRWLLVQGNRGVDIFLFLSGYGISFSLNKIYQKDFNFLWHKRWGGVFHWYIARYSKVLPTYIALSVIYFILDAYSNNQNLMENVVKGISTIGYFTSHKGFWFFALLFPLYLISPVLFRILNNSKCIKIAIVLSVIALYAATILSKIDNDILKNISFLIERAPSYFLGMSFFMLSKRKNHIPIYRILIYCAIGLCFIKIVMPNRTYWEFLMIFPMVVILITLFKKLKGSTIFKKIGAISMESYLTNGIMMVLSNIFIDELIPECLSFGNYFRYLIIIVGGLVSAYLFSVYFRPLLDQSKYLQKVWK